MTRDRLTIATAGWAIPRNVAAAFPSEGSGLQRYAQRFGGVEINSTFYRSHRASTFARWVAITPPSFAFAVKAPRTITHLARLSDCRTLLQRFAEEIRPLGEKLGPVLIQLPPSLAYERPLADAFFARVREVFEGRPIACEPRHVSWLESESDELLAAWRVARVAADPARHPLAATPGGWRGFEYSRLHGSPRMYYSAYDAPFLRALAERLRDSAAAESWCVFDNTTSGAAAANALDLAAVLGSAAGEPTPRAGVASP